ncbi:MAG: selenide, water dikinase SelD [Firmicutes bacterium]|nr:selenide, water dikinase SelD [Bacillota bacterium]
MDIKTISKLAACGGCTAKLPPGMLKDSLSKIPKFDDPNLLVGFDSSDDGAVYKLSDDIAIIQTLDFFPPMVDDPYLFGQVAAANALSDIYAMGGDVKVALNIVAFPENEDPGILAAILQGGGEKVKESGGVLCGGHSINDTTVKYGLSVTGVVHPDKIMQNNRCRIGDRIILSKPLGIGLVTSAYRVGETSRESFHMAVKSMVTLNKYAFEIAKKYDISSLTDVTGFGFLGHLNEMVDGNKYSIQVNSLNVNFIPEAERLAREFLLTSAGQKNRNFLADKVKFENVEDCIQEILFDPQTSGGLLIAVSAKDAALLFAELGKLDLTPSIVGEVVPRLSKNIIVW